MTHAELEPASFRFGANCTPPATLVGGFVEGSLTAPRTVVQAEALFRAFHELELPEGLDTDGEAYGTVFQYPKAEYAAHVRVHGSPKGYAGPAACCRLVWDIDRPDLEAALDDARKLARFLCHRYGTHAERALGIYFSGSKGFHLTLVNPIGFVPLRHGPAVVKLLCKALAHGAGVVVDVAIYDRQRLFRLPNTKHAKTGLYKRFVPLDDLDRLDVPRIREAAKHPAGFAVPAVTDDCELLTEDWLEAETRILANPGASIAVRVPPSNTPTVPKFVRDFIGFGDIQDPGRALTLFRCAAALAEGGTPAPVVFGLLEEPALKSGLDATEVNKQIEAGIAHGTRKGASCRS